MGLVYDSIGKRGIPVQLKKPDHMVRQEVRMELSYSVNSAVE